MIDNRINLEKELDEMFDFYSTRTEKESFNPSDLSMCSEQGESFDIENSDFVLDFTE